MINLQRKKEKETRVLPQMGEKREARLLFHDHTRLKKNPNLHPHYLGLRKQEGKKKGGHSTFFFPRQDRGKDTLGGRARSGLYYFFPVREEKKREGSTQALY